MEGFSKEVNDKTSSTCQEKCMNLHGNWLEVTLPFNKRDTESTEEEAEKEGKGWTYLYTNIHTTKLHACLLEKSQGELNS